ncbi:OmpA family protein [Parasediminibacterium sp. JCM 36343]|uniref:OmpA family protein n=1 Tax=Parasediminibacterium sp. JCM 36343 TaxID=3374279 RepID=UPI00397DA4D7
MKKITILTTVILLQVSAMAQQASDAKHAAGFYKKSEYYNAIINYEVYLGIRKPNVSFSPYDTKKEYPEQGNGSASAATIIGTSKLVTNKIAWELGESYRQQFNYPLAEKSYARILEKGTDTAYPLARYWHGVSLRSNNKFQEAAKEFQQFSAENTGNTERVSMANKELATLAFIKKQMLSNPEKRFTINKIGGDIAKPEGAYAPVVLGDKIVFTSARIVDTVSRHSSINTHVNHLFYNGLDTRDSIITGKSIMLTFPSKLSSNEGTVTFLPNKNKLFFSRASKEYGKDINYIYTSNRVNDSTWSEPVKLDTKVNKPSYMAIQPSVTQDGKYLLFASDRDGGAGKLDIWACELDAAGNPSEPFNLATINTKEDDQAPFYHTNSNTLVFSSKGYEGMGGFDIYSAMGTLKTLQPPVNLGYPVNSPRDDIYFFSASTDSLLKKAYISSDRSSDCCLEIFAIGKQIIKKKFKQRIEGKVTDCATNQPIASATVKLNTKKKEQDITTDKEGNFMIEKAENVAGFDVSKDGFDAAQAAFSKAASISSDTVYTVAICLNAVKPKTVEQVKDSLDTNEKPLVIYFDFDKSIIRDDAAPTLDQVLSLLNKYPSLSVALEIDGFTDAKGTEAYNLKLGKARAEACKQYLVTKGIDEARLLLKSYGKKDPVAPNTIDNKDNPEGRALNRRVEMKIKAKK